MFHNSGREFQGPFPTADKRAYHLFHGSMTSPHSSLQCVHPNLFKVSDVRTKDGEWIAPDALDRNRYAEDERCFLSRYIINNA